MTHSSLQCHSDKQIFDREMGKMEEWNSEYEVERGGTGDTTVVRGVREGFIGCRTMSFLSWADMMVCSILELA